MGVRRRVIPRRAPLVWIPCRSVVPKSRAEQCAGMYRENSITLRADRIFWRRRASVTRHEAMRGAAATESECGFKLRAWRGGAANDIFSPAALPGAALVLTSSEGEGV